jgi:hypothetical protein
MALADAWEHADPWPPAVAAVLDADPDLAGLELLLALPEHTVSLPGGARASQTDLFVLARTEHDVVAIAVEGKAKEPFGNQTVEEWRRNRARGETFASHICSGRSGSLTTGGSHLSAISSCIARPRRSSRRGDSGRDTR